MANEVFPNELDKIFLVRTDGTASFALQRLTYEVFGDRDSFVTTAKDKHKTGDVQHILHWLARDWGWDCAPGKIDVALRALPRDVELPETGTLDADTKQKLIDAHGTLATKTRVPEDVEHGR